MKKSRSLTSTMTRNNYQIMSVKLEMHSTSLIFTEVLFI